jgi:hypothetical protein
MGRPQSCVKTLDWNRSRWVKTDQCVQTVHRGAYEYIQHMRHYKKFIFYNSLVPLKSIISGTGAAIYSNNDFGPTGHHHPRSSPLPRVCTVLSASAIFKCILEVGVLCRCSVQPAILPRSPQLCLNGGLSVARGLSQASRVGEGDSHVLGEKGNVRWCVVVMQHCSTSPGNYVYHLVLFVDAVSDYYERVYHTSELTLSVER